MLALTFILTIVAMWYIYRKMGQVRHVVIHDRRKARYVSALSATCIPGYSMFMNAFFPHTGRTSSKSTATRPLHPPPARPSTRAARSPTSRCTRLPRAPFPQTPSPRCSTSSGMRTDAPWDTRATRGRPRPVGFRLSGRTAVVGTARTGGDTSGPVRARRRWAWSTRRVRGQTGGSP